MNIKKIFYEHIVPEAINGKINVYFLYSVAFSTRIFEKNRYYRCEITDNDVMIPTLMIRDKVLFDSLLEEYVLKASKFYDDDNFYPEILDKNNYDNKNMICKEKFIIMNLFANATVEDFNDPLTFLRKRIAFIDSHEDVKIDLGFSDNLKSNLSININKDTINNETPSEFFVKASDETEEWISPKVKFGIYGDRIYIYAIQNEERFDNNLSKKINRRMYKVGEGYTDDYTDENLKDVTASFLVTLNMFLSYFESLGYSEFIIPSMLIVRWNAKKIIIANKYKMKKIDSFKKQQLDNDLDSIQNNLTNKLIRTFLRLTCHFDNIEVLSFPHEVDSSLHIKINNKKHINCNNSLLYETSNMILEKNIPDRNR